jgi:hypothetical protein
VLEHAEGGAEGEVPDDVEGEVVEPVKGIDGCVARLGVLLVFGQVGPFLDEEFEIRVDVLLELADVFGGEGVGDDFAFARVFGSVASVEEASADGDEGVVVFTLCTSARVFCKQNSEVDSKLRAELTSSGNHCRGHRLC